MYNNISLNDFSILFVSDSVVDNVSRYHQCKLLLSVYRQLVSQIEEANYSTQHQSFGNGGIDHLVDFITHNVISKISKHVNKQQMMDIAQMKYIVYVMDISLTQLKSDADYKMHEILYRRFMSKKPFSDDDLKDCIGINDMEYQRKKKEAINLLSTIIWDRTFPKFKKLER